MKLYSYCRSSASYRLRIALKLKGLEYEYLPVNLLQGEQQGEEYRAVNPLGLVPSLVLEDGRVLTQSVAVLEYLEETCPEPPLLPSGPTARARVRAISHTIASEIQPICNIGVTEHLKSTFDAGKQDILDWFEHWMPRGLLAVEHMLAEQQTAFASGDNPGMADICLVPQVYNARRYRLDMDPYPNITRIADACNELSAFIEAQPENQPDFPT